MSEEKKHDLKGLLASYDEIEEELDSAAQTVAALKVRRSNAAEAIGKAIAPNTKLRYKGNELTYTSRKGKGSEVVTHYLKNPAKQTAEVVEV